MLELSDYLIGWGVYLSASVAFLYFAWPVTAIFKNHHMTSSVRAVLLALIFTPWYISSEEDLLAPAILVALLDAITIGPNAAIRPLVPLFLTIILLLLIVTLSVFYQKLLRRLSR